jgi:hypothetical protein
MSEVKTSALDEDGLIRSDVTDLNAILDNIDECSGRNDALRAYIYALRDLQHAHNSSAFVGGATDEDIKRAMDHVRSTFAHLIVTQTALNYGCSGDAEEWCRPCQECKQARH